MYFLKDVTPVVLTYNEAPNIGRCLERLAWAKEVLVIDSFSEDETISICATFPNTRIVQRHFDTHSDQWNFAIHDPGIGTGWVLAMDADYLVTESFVQELSTLSPPEGLNGYTCRFRYVTLGIPLRSGIYPPTLALFRRERGRYVQDGHTQRAVVGGKIGRINAPILHDDRKSFARWIESQRKYAALECNRITKAEASSSLGLKDWLRAKTPFAPIAVAFYCLVLRGGVFEGRAGLYYALQRMMAEAIISATFIDAKLRADDVESSLHKQVGSRLR